MGGDASPRKWGFGQRGSRAAELVLVAVLLGMVACAATWPLARSPAGRSLATGAHADVLLNQYLILWGAHALASADAELPHTNMFHPEPYTFAYSDMLLSSSLLAYPILALRHDPDLVYNLLLLSSMVIGGLGIHVLVRSLGLSAPAGAMAAILYAANPAHLGRILHIQLFTDHWLPWLLWATLLWLGACGLRGDGAPGTWRRCLVTAVPVAALFCVHALTGSHNAVFGALAVSLVVGAHLLGARRRLRWPEDRGTLARLAAGAGVAALLTAIILGPVFHPYLLVYEQLQEGRLGDTRLEQSILTSGSAGARELLSGASRFWLWLDQSAGWPSAWIGTYRQLRAHLFPGAVFVLLAVAGLWPLRPRRLAAPRALLAWGLDLVVLGLAVAAVATAVSGRYDLDPLGLRLRPATAFLYPLAMVVALVLRRLLGARIPWAGSAEAAALAAHWRTRPGLVLWAALALLCFTLALGPDGGLYSVLRLVPGIGLIRAPSRFLLPGLVALAVLAAYGVDGLRRRMGVAALPLLVAALLLFAYEGRLAPLRVGPPPYPPDELSVWLAEQRGDFAVLEVPVDTRPPAAVRQMIRSTRHWKKLLIGYSGSAPPGYAERMERLRRGFPHPRTLELLRGMDVRYVIVDQSLAGPQRARAARQSPRLVREVQFGPRVVYRIAEAAAAR